MKQTITSKLEYMVDFYRTAPFGETMFLLGAGIGFVNYDFPPLLFPGVYWSILGIAFTAEQFMLKRRLERSLSQHGYEDRVFETTIPEWCDRQMTRVVAEKHGCLEDYVALCEKHRDRMKLQNLSTL